MTVDTCPNCGCDDLWQQRRGTNNQFIERKGCTDCGWQS